MTEQKATTSEAPPSREARERQRNSDKKQQRRQKALTELNSPYSALILAAMGELSSEEIFMAGHGPVAKTRAMVQKANYQFELMCWGPVDLPPTPDDQLKDVPEPTRVLQRRHRGRSPFPFLAPPIVLPPRVKGESDFTYVERPEVVEALRKCPCRFRIMETLRPILHAWDELLADYGTLYGFLVPPMTPAEMDEWARYRANWYAYDYARKCYAAAVKAFELPVARGDWGACPANEVERLRPGIQIPERQQREFFLVKMTEFKGEEPQCLDFYGLEYSPLFRAPLIAHSHKILRFLNSRLQ